MQVVACCLLVLSVVCLPAAAEEAGRPIELCVRGDDMGHALDVNRAMIQAHVDGIVTSASLMPPAPYFDDAVAALPGQPQAGSGNPSDVDGDRAHAAAAAARAGSEPRRGRRFRPRLARISSRPARNRGDRKGVPGPRSAGPGHGPAVLVHRLAHGLGRRKDRPDIAALYPRLAENFTCCMSRIRRAQYTGAKPISAQLESWSSRRLPGRWFTGPCPASRRKFGRTFYGRLRAAPRRGRPRTRHPGFHTQRQAESVWCRFAPAKSKTSSALTEFGCISFADLWKRKYSK